MKDEKRIPDEIIVEGEKMEEKKKKRSFDIGEFALKVLAILFMGWITLKIILINVIDFRVFTDALDNHRLKLLLILAYRTGARLGELLALTYEDFSGAAMVINKQLTRGYGADGKPAYTIQPPKTPNAYREIPLTEDVMKAFREHERWHRDEMADKGYKTEYIFTTSTGSLYDRNNLRRALNRYYKKVGVEPKRFHSYRKTFCTNLCAAGAPLQVVYKIMGHSSIQVTAQYYVDVDLEQKRDALSLLKPSG